MLNSNRFPKFLVNGHNFYENVRPVLVEKTPYSVSFFQECPHRNILDCILVYMYVEPDTFGTDDAMIIANDIIDKVGLTETDLYEICLHHLPKQFVFDNLYNMIPAEMRAMVPDVTADFPFHMHILCNQDKRFGNGMILSETVLNDCLRKLKTSSVYILPCSVHEVLILPTSDVPDDIRTLKNIVMFMNCTELRPEEVFSNSVYMYSIENGLQIAPIK